MTQRSKPRSAFVATILLSTVCGVASAAFTAGQMVEVREGDDWSPATFLKQEGRKFQIKYADGTEEWVAADRLRAASGAAVAPGDAPAAKAGAITLDGPFTVINLQASNNRAPKRSAPNVNVVVPPATKPSQSFTDLTPNFDAGLGDVKDLVQCIDKPGTFVAVGRGAFRADDTPLLCIDVNNPSATEGRSLPAKHDILAAADGGRVLISRPSEMGALTLHLWEWVNDEYKLKANYTFGGGDDFGRSNKAPQEAYLLTPKTLLIRSGFEEVYLIDLPTRRQLAYTKLNDLKVHPSGRYLMGRIGPDALLLRSNDLAIVTMIPNVHNGFTLDATGNYAAYADGSGISVMRLNSKHTVGKLANVSAFRGDFELLGPDSLLVNNIYYDLKTGLPVWNYGADRFKRALLPNGQMLFVGTKDRQTVVVMGDVPDKKALDAKASASPDKFVLSPGARVAITGDLGAFGDATKAKQNVEKSLASAGHKSDDTAVQYKLNFASVAGPTEKWSTRMSRPFGMGMPSVQEVDAPSTIVTVTLTRDNETIWKQELKFSAGGVLNQKQGQSLQDAANDAAKPDVNRLGSLGVPSYLVGAGAGKTVRTLGESKVGRDGLAGE